MAEHRHYSVAEANALLPELRKRLERIRDQQQALNEDKAVVTIRQKSASNGGGGRPAQQLSEKLHALEREIEDLTRLGVILRDPATGLVDFYHRRDGDTVFLCWRLGEPAVAWWHPLQTGVAGRQPL